MLTAPYSFCVSSTKNQIGNAAGTPERGATLRRMLLEAVQALGSAPRNVRLRRALHHTYV